MRRLTILYRYYLPDTVVSAVLYGHLANHFVRKGYSVRVVCANHCIRSSSSKTLPKYETVGGVEIVRLWQPSLSRSIVLLRAVAVIWSICSFFIWSVKERFTKDEIVIIGSDPPLLVLIALAGFGKAKVFHWIFDLYPEAAVADGLIRTGGVTDRLVSAAVGKAIRRCFAVVLGDCMQNQLSAKITTDAVAQISPWAVSEASSGGIYLDELVRRNALLYSGSFGRAHTHSKLSDLLKALFEVNVDVSFSLPCDQIGRFSNLIDEEARVRIDCSELVSSDDILRHLRSFSVHLVIIAEGWEGIVIPSKFFGILAAGRPVFYLGSLESSIADWIDKFQLGWSSNGDDLPQVIEAMNVTLGNSAQYAEMCKRCSTVYEEHFSSAVGLRKWEKLLLGDH